MVLVPSVCATHLWLSDYSAVLSTCQIMDDLHISGKHQGKPSHWMDSTGKEVTLWQQMLDRPNFWVEGAVSLRPVDKMNSMPSPI